MEEATPHPPVSVIIPVRNSAHFLRRCLGSLLRGSRVPGEIIVVDDHSEDDTLAVAEEFGATVLRLSRQRGPAFARNIGALRAEGELLVFLDADVCVRSDTLLKIETTFARELSVDAVFGSYDSEPAAPNLVSQYKNLLHHFVHQSAATEAGTFWAGCGAIRRQAFLAIGGFDASYRRPSVEDIELGMRLRQAGYRVVLNPRVQATHLKGWSLWGLVCSDIRDRALPWTRLLLEQRSLVNDLNLKVSQRISTLLAVVGLLSFAVAAWAQPVLLLGPLLILACIAGIDRWTARHELSASLRFGSGAALVGVVLGLTWKAEGLGLFLLLLLAGIILLNLAFYRFLVSARGWFFALCVVPLHLSYFFYCGAAFGAGLLAHLGRAGRPRYCCRTQSNTGCAAETQRPLHPNRRLPVDAR